MEKLTKFASVIHSSPNFSQKTYISNVHDPPATTMHEFHFHLLSGSESPWKERSLYLQCLPLCYVTHLDTFL